MIRFGLDAVRGVGEDVAVAIAAGAPYVSLVDFLERCPAASTAAVSSLIDAGAFDSFGSSRAALVDALPDAVAVVATGRRLTALGQTHPLAGFHVDLSAAEWPAAERLAREYRALGLYVSGHPIDLYDQQGNPSVSELGDVHEGETVVLAGLVTAVEQRISRRGEPWATMTLADIAASIEVVWFRQDYAELTLAEGSAIAVKGRVSLRNDSLSIVGDRFEYLPERQLVPTVIEVDAEMFDLSAVRAQLANLDGQPVHLAVNYRGRVTTLRVLVHTDTVGRITG